MNTFHFNKLIAMSKTLTVAAAAVFLSGCVNDDSSQLRGYYSWGHEVETFIPCNSAQTFWVVGDEALLQPLRDKVADIAQAKGEPYPLVYIEASGVAEGTTKEGFAAQYDGVLRLTTVHSFNKSAPADCTMLDE